VREERARPGGGGGDDFATVPRANRVRPVRQVRFLSAGCDMPFPVSRGGVGIQGKDGNKVIASARHDYCVIASAQCDLY
jgi:hypothetical protein